MRDHHEDAIAKLGVEAKVEARDRLIFLRCFVRDRDWEQVVNFSGAVLDTYMLLRSLKTRAGNNTLDQQETHVHALIDRIKEVPTEEAYLQAGHDRQR